MASSVLYSLSLLLVTAGLALLAASFRIARLARRHRQRMEKLLQLANRDIEPLELPAAAWPQLTEAGWQHLTWEGVWFGQAISGALGALPLSRQRERVAEGRERGNADELTHSSHLDEDSPSPPTPLPLAGEERIMPRWRDFFGKKTSPVLEFKTGGDETRLRLSFTHTALRGEERLFAEQLAQVFILLLETRLRARSEALAAALAERARLSLYLQHDMRNLAQWVCWVSADFTVATNTETLISAATRLRDNAPLAQDRAERLIAALGQSPAVDLPKQVDLRQVIVQTAQLAGFQPEISGEAQAWIAKSLLTRALDNLFTNLAAVWRDPIAVRPVFHLRTFYGSHNYNSRNTPRPLAGEGQEKGEIDFFCPWPEGSAPLSPEKLFEPFASGSPGGLGLGLYQARKSLMEAGGNLSAMPSPEGLHFLLSLPATAP